MPSKVDRERIGPAPAGFPDDPHHRSPTAGAWDELQREIESCTRCPLHTTRTHVVVYRGSRAPRVVFIGEAPGAEEDRLGVPFVGRSGRCLDAALAQIGLSAEEFGILNLIKCRPPQNRFDVVAARTCRPYLDRQLALLKPAALVTLGARALASVDPTAPRILLCAGTPRHGLGRALFPLIHPAAALRSTRLAHRWDRDVQRLEAWLSTLRSRVAREPLYANAGSRGRAVR